VTETACAPILNSCGPLIGFLPERFAAARVGTGPMRAVRPDGMSFAFGFERIQGGTVGSARIAGSLYRACQSRETAVQR
jgi:hypothetical protein